MASSSRCVRARSSSAGSLMKTNYHHKGTKDTKEEGQEDDSSWCSSFVPLWLISEIELQLRERAVDAALVAEQLLVRAGLHDAAGVDDEDAVGPPHRRQPVGDD